MKRSTRPLFRFSLCGLLFLLPALPLHAQLLTFDMESPGDERVLVSESIHLDGTPYVSLPLLMEQAGGAYNMLPTRVRVDYKSTTAWLTVDDVRVHALTIFSLRNPILKQEEEALIAVVDVAPFFLKAFRTRVSLREPVVETDAQSDDPEEGPKDLTAITVRPSGEPVRVIVIDPGHGGYDQGLRGVAGYPEKALSLDVALRLKPILQEALTQKVVLTRSEDIGLPTSDRVTIANNSGGDLLISIHAGGMMTPRTSGIALYYKPSRDLDSTWLPAGRRSPTTDDTTRSSRLLAYSIAAALREATTAPLRGVHEAPIRLLRDTQMPSVMVEVGCLTNPSEETQLQSEAYRESIAQGIARGVLAYLQGPQALSRAEEAGDVPRLDARSQERN